MKTEAEVITALATKFASPEWAFFEHVRNGTGYARRTTRTADALAMSLWPSRGLELHGFEVKVSRADWLREKNEPEKAEDFFSVCDRWWLAVSDPTIVGFGELPPTWGLLVPKGGKLVVKTEAPKLEAKPLDRLMLAAILRKATENVTPNSIVSQRIEEGVKAGTQNAATGAEWELGQAKRTLAELEQRVREFEEKSGVQIGRWDHGRVAKAVRVVLAASDAEERAKRTIADVQRDLKNALAAVEGAADEVARNARTGT